MTVIEKVAYLRGLADGLKLTDTTAEGKVLLNVIEVLDDLALSVTDLEDAVEELGEVVDAIDAVCLQYIRSDVTAEVLYGESRAQKSESLADVEGE